MKSKEKKTQIPFRLNILFFIVFLMFAILIVQLGIVQILQGESYQAEIDRKIMDTTKSPVPRGKIIDRTGNVVVNNKPLYSIVYTPPKDVQAEDKLELAEKLIDYLAVDDEAIEKLSSRNKQEYWYLKNINEAVALLTKEEETELTEAKKYQLILDRIKEQKEDELNNYSKEELKVIAIKKELDKAYALTPQVIKNKNISIEEYAKIAENLSELPGINVSTDWERELTYGDTLKSFIGSITSQDQGIPAEKEQYYLTRGYSRNDRVGKNGLEEQYESYLRGRKEQIQYTITKTGTVVDSKVVVDGERGKDLVLSIDMEYQQKVDDIVRNALKSAVGLNYHLEDALAVVMNPKTGEILAMSGQHYNRKENKFENTPHKVVYDAHRPGSTVKGATVLAGLDSGVIAPNTTFDDRPIRIGTLRKGSYQTLGAVNDISALKRSSNVYMFYIALKMGGEHRYPFPDGAWATFNEQGLQDMRNYYHQFGLGVETGIDFPFEATGFVGSRPRAGNFLDFAIGQYDTYTTLQLAQYVSTIANDGYRVRPHLVKEIREPSTSDDELGPVYKVNNTEVLNRVDMSDEHIKRVQEGFRQAFRSQGGTGYSYWANKSYEAAGKTGTAENEIYRDGRKIADTENLALVGYAPYNNPEVAFAVIVPNLSKSRGNAINHKIGTGILDAYFDMKKSSTKKEDNEENN